MSSKRKQIYLSILGVGVCVVVYDIATKERGPAKAAAAVTVESSSTETTVTKAPRTGIAALSIQPFPREFEEHGVDPFGRDIFAPSDAVVSRLLEPPAVSADGKATEDEAARPAVPFGQQHSLSAILKLQGDRSAVVDGVIYRKGQKLEDCTLVEIAERSVQFDCPGGTEELSLFDPILGERPAQ